jgi:putative peptide zinc metalloprotease protein
VVPADIRPLDTSERGDVYLLPAGEGGYLRLSADAVRLLRAVDEGVGFAELARRSRRGAGGPVTAGDVEAAHGRLLERIAEADADARTPGGGFWLRLRLIPASLVERVAAACSGAYHPLAASLLGLFVVGGAACGLAAGAQFATPAPGDFWTGYAVFLASLLAHEIGHASACARFGARPSEIGVVLYLVYPAFYSNVTAAWTLPRRQRVVVDLGGVYFQLVFAAACAFAWAAIGWAPLGVTLALIAGSCLLSLNPFLKLDGYWVVADALGVTNLGRQPARIAGHLWRRLRGSPVEPWPWPAPIAWTLVVYAVSSCVFLAWFLGGLMPLVLDTVRGYPALLLVRPLPLAELAPGAYVLLFAGLFALRILRRLVSLAGRAHFG